MNPVLNKIGMDVIFFRFIQIFFIYQKHLINFFFNLISFFSQIWLNTKYLIIFFIKLLFPALFHSLFADKTSKCNAIIMLVFKLYCMEKFHFQYHVVCAMYVVSIYECCIRGHVFTTINIENRFFYVNLNNMLRKKN